MDNKAYYVTEGDREVIRQIVRREMGRPANTVNRAGSQAIDHQEHQAPEVYVARTPSGGIPKLTEGVTPGVNDKPGHADCFVYKVATVGSDDVILPIEGLFKRVYNMADAVTGDSWVLVWRDKAGTWWTQQGGSAGFWARIWAKTYVPGWYIQYSWTRVIDGLDPYPVIWEDQEQSGGPYNFPAYHVNNIDLPVSQEAWDIDPDTGHPVDSDDDTDPGTGTWLGDMPEDEAPLIVWLRPGNGDYYLIDMVPWWEPVEKVSGPDGQGYFHGYQIRWNQYTKAWEHVEQILIIDMNSPPPV